MTFELPAAHRLAGLNSMVAFEVPLHLRDAWQEFCKQGSKTNDYFDLKITTLRRGRSTGEKSQSHHINGHIQQIAMETGNDFAALKLYFKDEAIAGGWPFVTLPNGRVLPKSESEASVEEASVLIETIHRFAAEWNICLREE